MPSTGVTHTGPLLEYLEFCDNKESRHPLDSLLSFLPNIDLRMCGATPPPAAVALMRESNSSPRIASASDDGVTRFTCKFFDAFPAHRGPLRQGLQDGCPVHGGRGAHTSTAGRPRFQVSMNTVPRERPEFCCGSNKRGRERTRRRETLPPAPSSPRDSNRPYFPFYRAECRTDVYSGTSQHLVKGIIFTALTVT